ncbi:MAG: hypothetical protein ACI8XM_001236 [Haloarculaceae archaeon]|jgi:hypothetical protein
MDKNVGGLDRNARFVVGALLAVAGIAAVADFLAVGVVIGAVALVVAAILLVTGATQKCPLNEVAGVDTYNE